MVFSSTTFLFYFLPIVLIAYFLVPRKVKNPVLLIASLFFYSWGEPVYILLMIFSIVLDYLLGLWLESYRVKKDMRGAKRVLILAVALNLALLAVFKYADFAMSKCREVSYRSAHMYRCFPS